MSSFSSPGSQNSSAKKCRRNEIWEKFQKEENTFCEIKWKCSECQERLRNNQTSLSRHWELKHNDKQQAATKIGSLISGSDAYSKNKFYNTAAMQISTNANYVPVKVCTCQSHNQSVFLHGTVLPTTSDEFPFVIYYSGRKTSRRTFLFPASLLFSEYQERHKLGKKEPKALHSGDKIDFAADSYGVVFKFERIVGFGNEAAGAIDSSIMIEDQAVFSPDTPQRCCSSLFGLLPSSAGVMTVVPNIVYEIRVKVRVSLQYSSDGNGLPLPCVTATFDEILKPVGKNHSNELIYKAPWNNDTRTFCHPQYRVSYSSERDLKARPSLPKIHLHGVLLYCLENNEVIWPKNPKFKVVIALPIHHNGKVLKEGCAVQADMYYCKFNHFYVVRKYFVLKPNNCAPLETRRRMDDQNDEIGGHVEYHVTLRRSSQLGFFVCKEFDYCLVEDSKRLLVNAASGSKRKYFPVWLRRNDPSRLAKFKISALDEQHYNPFELWSAFSRVKSTGFLVNNCTGSVFARNYPLERIILPQPDRRKIQVGDWISFEAVYFPLKDIYVVLELSPIESKSPISVIPWRGGFLFEDILNCTKIYVGEKVYAAKNFGLVMDPENLIVDRARKKRIELPESISVVLEENEQRTRCTAFKIYALSLDSKEREMEHRSNTVTGDEMWWKPTELNDCKCHMVKKIRNELLMMQSSQFQYWK